MLAAVHQSIPEFFVNGISLIEAVGENLGVTLHVRRRSLDALDDPENDPVVVIVVPPSDARLMLLQVTIALREFRPAVSFSVN